MIFNNISNERGAALATVIIMGMVIGILALSTYKYADVRAKQTGHVSLRREAQYSSQAGLEIALYGLRNKTEDSLRGIIDPTGASAGFEEGARYLDVDAATLGEDRTSSLNRRSVEVSITESGTTSDGLRKRYKIISKTKYVE